MPKKMKAKLHSLGTVSIAGRFLPGWWFAVNPGRAYYQDREAMILSPILPKNELREWIAENAD